MKDLKLTTGRTGSGNNCANDPGKIIFDQGAPKQTDNGGLDTGYTSVGNPGRSPNADANSRNR